LEKLKNTKGDYINMAIDVTFSEVELGEDLKGLVSFNSDSYLNEELKETIMAFDDDDLIKVTKQIASPIKIIAVEKVNEEMIEASI